MDLGLLNLSLEGQAEGHLLGASISGKAGIKTLETRPGIKAYLGAGATLLVGGKLGVSADLSIHPRVLSAYDSAIQYVTPKVNSAIQYISPKIDSAIQYLSPKTNNAVNWVNSFLTPAKR